MSLVVLLQHTTKVVKPRRTFLVIMYSEAARLPCLSFYIWIISKDFQSDRKQWHLFVYGVGFLEYSAILWPLTSILRQMHPVPGLCSIKPMDIMEKKLAPIVLSCSIWSPLPPRKIKTFKCNNRGLVDTIYKGSSKEPVVVHLLRCLWFFQPFWNHHQSCSYIWSP